MWRGRQVHFVLQLPSDSTFFGLTLEYSLGLRKEIYYMVKHMRYSYESVMCMPVWERRIYLDLWQQELEEQKKEYDKAKPKKR